MALSTRLIRRRIKSIVNTRKITKAMELVAASKMRKAISAVLATRPYANSAWRAIEEIAKVTDPTIHPLLKKNTAADRQLVIVFTSDRGLCGGINSRMFRAILEFLGARDAAKVDFVAVGKKGQQYLKRQRCRIVATFPNPSHNPRLTEIQPIARLAIDDYVRSAYDAVHLAFTDYRSAMMQEPLIRRLLPIAKVKELGNIEPRLSGVQVPGKSGAEDLRIEPDTAYEYLFEPSPETVLDAMLPRLVETQIYQALLESLASEHSARMMAMRSASDSATDMVNGLTLTLNQARQAGITMEIAEISSGKAALEK
jgi:F-type H+-transporting ATPase subunit gamma